MIARVIVKLVNESEYSFSALAGENITGVEHLQEFGFASRPPSNEDGTNNANGIAVFYGGDRGNSSLLVLEIPKFKPDLEKGETALFNAMGALIKLAGTDIQLNGTDNGGIVQVAELTEKVNALIAELQIHTHNSGGSGTPTSTFTELARADYENTKVVH